MQKVEGSSPFIRFNESPAPAGFFSVTGFAAAQGNPTESQPRGRRDMSEGATSQAIVPAWANTRAGTSAGLSTPLLGAG